MTAGQGQSQLRSAVLAGAWRRIPGVEVLSATDGGPLTRTVKKIVDPLVIRTAARPRLGRPLLDPAAAAEVAELLLADSARLRATAAWFPHLKRQRRALRITAGNVQDVCFPLAYELATAIGMPDASAPEQAATALREWHGEDSASGVDQLSRYLADPRHTADLTAELRHRWVTAPDASPAAFVRLLDAVANGFTDAAWQALADSPAGHAFGLALRQPGGTAALARAVREVSGLPAPDLGLQRGERTAVPPLSQRDETGGELLERSIERRIRASLRRLPAAEQNPVADLVDEELLRAAAGFGLELPVLATCFVLGVVLAPALRPLDGPTSGDIPEFAQRLNAQVSREGYVLYARRALAGSTPLTAQPDDEIVRELREFAKRFLARLWARLHGFDVSGEVPATAADIRDLLTGVVRSTSLDLRTKVRRALVANLPRLEAAS
ncbi:hypothetical protein [Amycolatopsis circi]|uniref:hypothetical protein n=1 Tax=Amycolatopsis circi TaxID=871959 RepID=UPI000E264407|nr:hypothetical protein [Amycolatopsis circi]